MNRKRIAEELVEAAKDIVSVSPSPVDEQVYELGTLIAEAKWLDEDDFEDDFREWAGLAEDLFSSVKDLIHLIDRDNEIYDTVVYLSKSIKQFDKLISSGRRSGEIDGLKLLRVQDEMVADFEEIQGYFPGVDVRM